MSNKFKFERPTLFLPMIPEIHTNYLRRQLFYQKTIPLQTLVGMKLNAFRRKDQMHLIDIISLDMIDRSWLEYYPDRLDSRLQELLDDPDG